MLLLIDNYDSFTYNLVHEISVAAPPDRRPEIVVRRNDALSVDEALALKPDAIVLSPGPKTPAEAGLCVDLVKAASDSIPILGVCLGHQAIGEAFGGEVRLAEEMMHGKTSPIRHGGLGVFRDVPSPTEATRYHSLTIAPDSLPAALEVTAQTDDGVVMGVRHRANPTHGVQFHPESIRSEHGRRILANFLELAELI